MQKIMVVMPTYNEKDALPLMVEAIFALNISGLEMLVVDDNSPDGTGQIADNLREQYDNQVNVLHRAEKAGL